MRTKVFCIGAHKTGTTSMEAALTALGLRVAPTQLWWNDPALQTDFYEGRYQPVFDVIAGYDAFQDSPYNHSEFYKVLHERYPDARFVLTVRNAGNWVASRRRWRAALHAKLIADNNLQLERAGRLFFEREYGQSDYLNADEEAETRVYETRNRAVISFFSGKAAPLLVLDLEQERDAWQLLCGFLGLAVPSDAFPHANRTK
jgi:hypothetical protein